MVKFAKENIMIEFIKGFRKIQQGVSKEFTILD